MKTLIVLISIFLSCSLSGQNAKLRSVNFTYKDLSSSFSGIDIEIIDNSFQNKEGKIVLKVTKYSMKERRKKTTEYFLSIDQYNEICNSILRVNPNEILADPDYIVLADGDYTEISCTSFYGKITYGVLHFDYDEKTSPSKDFIKAVRLLLNHAKVEI